MAYEKNQSFRDEKFNILQIHLIRLIAFRQV